MAKPITITPILKGKDAINFFNKLKTNRSKRISTASLQEIRKDAEALRSISKH